MCVCMSTATFELARAGQDEHGSLCRTLLHVELAHVDVSLLIHGQARGTHSATQLVEDAAVVYSRGLLEEAEHSVGHHLRHIAGEKVRLA